jgi:rhodanese-related sulfurtransferase
MRSLRILLLNSARRWIGEAAHTFTLARALESRGHWVLLGVRRGFELEKRAAAEGLRYRAFTLNSRFIPWDDLRDTRAIRQILRDEKIDLIQVNRGKDHWLAAAAQLFAARPPVPLIRARHVVTPPKITGSTAGSTRAPPTPS